MIFLEDRHIEENKSVCLFNWNTVY